MQNITQSLEEDKIDLRELFSILKEKKTLIWTVTVLFTLLALTYVLLATQWWQVNATLEIGKYPDQKTSKEIYLENGAGVSERLKIKYIDVYEHVKDREGYIKHIQSSKKNPQFISITALGKDNTLALTEVQKVIDEMQNKHQNIIDEIIAKKQSSLDKLDRSIFSLEQHKIPSVSEKITYTKNVVLTAIDDKIKAVQNDLEKSINQKDKALKNLLALNNKASLAALRMSQIQALEYKISANELKLIDLHTKKEQILSSTLPDLERKLERMRKIDVVNFQEERKLIKLSMQTHNYHNTAVIGDIIVQDKPVKPKKALTVIVAFITGLMFSVFLVFFLAFARGLKEEESK